MPRSSQSQATADSPRKLILQLTPLLLEEFALLGKELEEKSSAYDIVPDVAPELRRLAYWVSSNARELIVLGALLWRANDLVSLARTGTLMSAISHAHALFHARLCSNATPVAGQPAAKLLLLVVGTAPAIDDAIGMVTLEAACAVRRIAVEDVSQTLHAYTCVLSRKVSQSADFLHGLSARDVRHNRSAGKSFGTAWLGALKQLLPEASAKVVFVEFPTFRKLYTHLSQRADAQSALADLRVGSQRMGPAKAKKLARVLMATRAEAAEAL